MSTIINVNGKPRSSCCMAEIKITKDYTDTHVFVANDIDLDSQGNVESVTYVPVKIYDGIDSENWQVECSKCGSDIDTDDIDLREE